MKNWRKTTLGELVEEGSASYQTGPFGTTLKASEYAKEGVPLISVGEIREGYIQVHPSTPRVCEKTTTRLPKYVLEEEDIVFGRKGAINRNAIIQKHQAGWFLGSDGIRLRLSDEHSSAFISYQLRTASIQEWLMNNGKGAIMPTLNQKILDRLPIAIPPLPTQQKIAKVLATLDAKIALNNRINAELEALAKLLYDYWFVQFDFPMTAAQAAALGQAQLEGQPYKSSGGKMVFNPTLKREIPEGWEARSISSLSHLNEKVWTDKTAPETLLYVDLANTKNGQILEKRRYHWEEAPSRARRILRAGDTIVGTVRPGNRSFCLIPNSDEPLTSSTGFAVLTPSNPSYREFNYLSLTSDTNIARLETLASGAAYPAVNPEVVASANIAMPPASLIESFHEKTANQFKLIQNHQKQNQELTTLRDWLLPMLMNGQVTVDNQKKSGSLDKPKVCEH